MQLAQLSYKNLIVCMLAEDWEVYKESKFSKSQTICEYTKTGRIKKNSEYHNEGVTFIKYINFSELYHDIANRDTAEYKLNALNKIHSEILKNGITFNLANWMPRGMIKVEGNTLKAKSNREYKQLMKDYDHSIMPSAAQTILENLASNKYKEIL